MTLTVDEAFRKFKNRLELNDKEQENATKRHNEVRDILVRHLRTVSRNNNKSTLNRGFVSTDFAGKLTLW